ncbi:hypothetical protein PVAND_005376 [Polypedilum vanderplanki]|uniref:Uncharacterized protein n=1 Tax=Polypedilum vanderplanki TaxID=319348 RepID=A0A9J6C0Y0_POLVA|nr:hypothetical protein PVAND_005376 [Polypedilum vanderplanki]
MNEGIFVLLIFAVPTIIIVIIISYGSKGNNSEATAPEVRRSNSDISTIYSAQLQCEINDQLPKYHEVIIDDLPSYHEVIDNCQNDNNSGGVT